MMKKIYFNITCVLCALCGLSSCGDFLEVEPRDIVILEKFWNEESDVEASVAGCYAGLQEFDAITRMMAWGEFRSDNINEGGKCMTDDYHMYKYLNENIDASNVYTKWDVFYRVINRCNTVLLYAPQVKAKDPAYNNLDAHVAEVTAIRSLCYFYLIRTFHNVPYITTAYTDDNQPMDIKPTPFDEVLDSLISSLENVKDKAVNRYPESDYYSSYYNYGRITKDAIYAMLCDMYLWKQDYAKCIEYADLIVEHKRALAKDKENNIYYDMDKYFSGYPLIRDWSGEADTYGNAYNQIFSGSGSDESIFELVFMSDNSMPANGPVNTYYGYDTDGGYQRVKPSEYVGIDFGSNKFFGNNKRDTRSQATLDVSTSQGAVASYIRKYRWLFVRIQWDTDKSKLTTEGWNSWIKDRNRSNWIIYRLTDVMLMKAEALVQQAADIDDQKIQEAFDIVQAVYRRSYAKDPDKITDSELLQKGNYASKEDFEELVLLERQRELLFEGKRWYDLVRRTLRDGNTANIIKAVGQKGLKNADVALKRLTDMNAIFLPYNIDDTKVNHWLKEEQNPAFNSGETEK